MNRGNNNQVGFQDGIYAGFLVNKDAGALNTIVQQGLAIVGDKIIDRQATTAATPVAVSALPGVHVLYLNAADAAGSPAQVTDNTAEADVVTTSIVGSTATMSGRSLKLANVTVAGNFSTVTPGGTFLAADTVTVTFDSENIVTTLATADVASLSTVASAIAGKLNADATFAAKAVAVAASGVVTITALTASAYTCAVAKVSTSGTIATSGTGAGAIITNVDCSVQLSSFAPAFSTKVITNLGV